jgi:hypothetical protein
MRSTSHRVTSASFRSSACLRVAALAVAGIVAHVTSAAGDDATGASLQCPQGTAAMSSTQTGWREEWCQLPDGTRHGPTASWYAAGQPQQRGEYRNGQPHGRWAYWYENGAKRAEGTWRDGRVDGYWAYWGEAGARQSAGRFRDGGRWGRWRYWDDAGRLREEGVWRGGEKRGTWTEVSPEDGRLRVVRYRRGVATGTSVYVTMDELHAAGGVPRGWTFAPPPGDPTAGRRLFERYGCHTCHVVAGEAFGADSAPAVADASVGPELTGMGRHHPPGYFAESVVNPDAVIVEGPGHVGPDGRSRMPAYPDMTLVELADLVAYLTSLRDQECAH